jgi:hypothetical protein
VGLSVRGARSITSSTRGPARATGTFIVGIGPSVRAGFRACYRSAAVFTERLA